MKELTPYELWQLNKFGNIIPEQEINEQDYEWHPGYSYGKNPETVCNSERPSFPYDQVGRNSEGFPSLSNFL